MKEIGTCKECRWWEGYVNSNIRLEVVWGACDKGIMSSLNRVTIHGQDYVGVDKNFGCIHWEAKDE